jgi:hypothetical protein
MLPYSITKDFWYEGTREGALQNAIEFLDNAEDYKGALSNDR